MNGYLAQNKKILDELSTIAMPLKLNGQKTSSSTKMQFITSGTFQSSYKGLIYMGVKMPLDESVEDKNKENTNITSAFYRALTNIAFIHQTRPELANQLPLFYGLLVNQNNNPHCIITQDFSENAKQKIMNYREFPHANIPDGLVDLFEPGLFDMIQLEKTLFYVNGERKIGDLDHVHPKKRYMQKWEEIHQEAMSSNPVVKFIRAPFEELISDENNREYANNVLETCKNGSKSRLDLIYTVPIDKVTRISSIMQILDTLVNNCYLETWEEDEERMFSLL